LAAAYFIKGMLVRSPDAIFIAGTRNFDNKSIALKEKGVKQKINSLLFN